MKKLLIILVVMSFVCAGAAQAITVENQGFELPGTVKMQNWEEVPGWSSDWVADASGVEENPYVGDWNGYVMAGTNPGNLVADPSVWQLTGHTAAAGDVLDLAVMARIGWMSTRESGAVLGDTADFRMTLYYDDGGTRVVADTDDFTMITTIDTGWNGLRSEWIDYTLELDVDAECPDAVGHDIGIEFYGVSYTGSNGCWLAMDDVRLVPEPATMMLLGLGSLALLKRRRA